MKLSAFYHHAAEAARQQGMPVERILELLKGAGVSGLETALTELPEALPLITGTGMEISCVYGNYQWPGEDEGCGEELVLAAAMCGAKDLLVVPGFFTEAEGRQALSLKEDRAALFRWMDENRGVQRVTAALRNTVAAADQAECGLRVSLEDYDNLTSPCALLEELEYYLVHVPGLKITLDTGNFAYSDEDAEEAASALLPWISHCHCKDRGEEPGVHGRFNRGMAAVPAGGGWIPLKRIVPRLMKSGYRDWFVIEHFGSRNYLEDLLASARYLQELEKASDF